MLTVYLTRLRMLAAPDCSTTGPPRRGVVRRATAMHWGQAPKTSVSEWRPEPLFDTRLAPSQSQMAMLHSAQHRALFAVLACRSVECFCMPPGNTVPLHTTARSTLNVVVRMFQVCTPLSEFLAGVPLSVSRRPLSNWTSLVATLDAMDFIGFMIAPTPSTFLIPSDAAVVALQAADPGASSPCQSFQPKLRRLIMIRTDRVPVCNSRAHVGLMVCTWCALPCIASLMRSSTSATKVFVAPSRVFSTSRMIADRCRGGVRVDGGQQRRLGGGSAAGAGVLSCHTWAAQHGRFWHRPAARRRSWTS